MIAEVADSWPKRTIKLLITALPGVFVLEIEVSSILINE